MKIFAAASLAALLPFALVQAADYSITGVISETVQAPPTGTPVVSGSGSVNNTTDWEAGVVGQFEINNGEYYLRVSALNPTGGLAGTESPDTAGLYVDSLMVVRTVDSQGLTDTGTLSVYIRATSTWTLDLKFEFFSDAAFLTPAELDLTMTSLDIDASQRYYTSNASFDPSQAEIGSEISTITSGGSAIPGYTGYTSSGSADFDDPGNAVRSVANGLLSEYDVKVAHNGVALFMFEFRANSEIIP